MSPEPDAPRSRRGPLARTAALACVLGIASLGAVHHLAKVSGGRSMPAGAVADPEVTGSIATAVRSVTLDPCNGRERLLVRGPVGRDN